MTNSRDGQVSARRTLSLRTLGLMAAGLLAVAAATLLAEHGASGWQRASIEVMALRWPRLVPGIFAGVSSGASFAIVLGVLFCGVGTGAAAAVCALAGSVLVITALILFSRRAHFAPSSVILLGIAVSACLDSATTLVLSRGSMENYFLLQWLSGTTYRTTPVTALLLATAVIVLMMAAFAVSRALTLVSVCRNCATGRGLRMAPATAGLLLLCALLCAAATTAMGPVAPHMAALAGARTVKSQLFTAGLLWAVLVSAADWLGQVLLAPALIPAGTQASVLGAGYFLLLLVAERLKRSAL